MGVAGGLVALLDFKSSGGSEKPMVGSIPIYSRQRGAGLRFQACAFSWFEGCSSILAPVFVGLRAGRLFSASGFP